MSPYNPLAHNRSLIVLGGVLIVVVLGYALFVATPYLLGPSLTISAPQQGATIESPLVEIRGSAARVSYLSIDGMPVPLSTDGSFSVVRAYPAGYTVLVVRARDRFDREVVETVPFMHAITITHTATTTYGKN